MTEFTAKIAGYSIRMRVLFPETKELFHDYLTEEPPLFLIESSEQKLQDERQLIMRNDEKGKLSMDCFSDSQIESNYLYREVAECLSVEGVVLLHGSAIAVDGEAYIFVAPSGVGKSTHTRLWREVFGKRAVMINDDKPLLKCAEDGIMVYGSPWNGKHKLGGNLSAPLKAICFLNRGDENRIEAISDREAFLPMLKAAYPSQATEREACILRSLHCIRRKTAFYQLKCNMEREAAIVAYTGMNTTTKAASKPGS